MDRDLAEVTADVSHVGDDCCGRVVFLIHLDDPIEDRTGVANGEFSLSKPSNSREQRLENIDVGANDVSVGKQIAASL